MTQAEWNAKVRKLEQGISPDGLPINPPRRSLLDPGPGHFSYIETKFNRIAYSMQRIRRWYTVRRLSKELQS